MRKNRKILLTEQDKKVFFEALMNPPEPNDFLKKAMADYKKTVVSKD